MEKLIPKTGTQLPEDGLNAHDSAIVLATLDALCRRFKTVMAVYSSHNNTVIHEDVALLCIGVVTTASTDLGQLLDTYFSEDSTCDENESLKEVAPLIANAFQTLAPLEPEDAANSIVESVFGDDFRVDLSAMPECPTPCMCSTCRAVRDWTLPPDNSGVDPTSINYAVLDSLRMVHAKYANRNPENSQDSQTLF
jgi:hypothetical protein